MLCVKDVLDKPGIYAVHVVGRLDPIWVDEKWGLKAVYMSERAYNYSSITILIGSLPDQAALYGLLNTLYNSRCPLLLVRYLSPTL